MTSFLDLGDNWIIAIRRLAGLFAAADPSIRDGATACWQPTSATAGGWSVPALRRPSVIAKLVGRQLIEPVADSMSAALGRTFVTFEARNSFASFRSKTARPLQLIPSVVGIAEMVPAPDPHRRAPDDATSS